MTLVNSWTCWQPLEEVWLGDVYPTSWYDHLEPEVRDCFYEITEKTKHDLLIIENKLKEFGVNVVRPVFNKIDDFLEHNDRLVKPMITPRDMFIVYGNLLSGSHWHTKSWQPAIDRYQAADPGSCNFNLPHPKNLGTVSGANTVRVGKDFYLDIFWNKKHITNYTQESALNDFNQHVAPLYPNSRLHLLANGGHVDGCFAVVKPGLLISSRYFDDYDRTFPNWNRIHINAPEFANHFNGLGPRKGPYGNGKWWIEGMNNKKSFNEHVIKHAQDWVGDYTETYFEVNSLVVDEKNILMLGENEGVFRKLEEYGVTAHPVPFRTRTFWDGGLHCLTLDIRRQGGMIDAFSERDSNKQIYLYD
jgi:hypothetical protein